MSKYEKVSRATNSDFFIASTKNYIFNQSERLIYMELIGQQRDVTKLSAAIIGNESVYLDDTRFHAESSQFKVEKHTKNHATSIIYAKDLFQRNSKIFIGRDDNEIYGFFKKWLKESQTLPYPQGYKEDLLMEAEQYIFNLMVEQKLLVELNSSGDIKGYELKNEDLANGGEQMQDIILECVKSSGLLEVDRLRKKLKTAPLLGDSKEEPDVYVVFKSAQQKFYAVEYDPDTDNVFCLIVDGDERLWEEHNFGELFEDEDISLDKSLRAEDIYIDSESNIQERMKNA